MQLSFSFLKFIPCWRNSPGVAVYIPCHWGNCSRTTTGFSPWSDGVSSVLNVPNAGIGTMLSKWRATTILCWWATEIKTNKIRSIGCSMCKRKLSFQIIQQFCFCFSLSLLKVFEVLPLPLDESLYNPMTCF